MKRRARAGRFAGSRARGAAMGALLLVLAAFLSLLSLSAHAAEDPPRVERVLVAFQPGAPAPRRSELLARLGVVPDPSVNSRYFTRLSLPGPFRSPAGAARLISLLRRDPSVRVVEPDWKLRAFALPDDPELPRLWGFHNTGQTGGRVDADVDAPEAWGITTGSEVVTVAVVDSGIDLDHPDLRTQLLRSSDGSIVGYDFLNQDEDPRDDFGHGTHVAGTIAARSGNGIGAAGLAPGVRLMPLKFLDQAGFGDTSNAILSIDFALARRVSVINCSFGGGDYSILMREALQRARDAGVLVVAAAGNDQANVEAIPSFPAGYNAELDNVLSVAATTHDDTLASFSNYGARAVDLAAPGQTIYSTVPHGYGYKSGTSMAAPLVSAAAALLRSRKPSIGIPELRTRLLATADRVPALAPLVASGRLNAARALAADPIAPGAPAGFHVSHRAADGVLLRWKASGDDGPAGAASAYELWHSTQPITPERLPLLERAERVPVPGSSGASEQWLFSSLEAGKAYYFALRAMDDGGNVSPLITLGPVETLGFPADRALFFDNAEGGPLFAGPSPWGISAEQSFSPTRAYSDSPGAPYRSHLNLPLTQSAGVTLTGVVPELRFAARTELEPFYDQLLVELSRDDGATWHRLPLVLTGESGWTRHRLPLSRELGESVRVRFRLLTDAVETDNGVWLDDIELGGTALYPVDVPLPAAPGGLAAHAARPGEIDLAWTDRSGDEAEYHVERRGTDGLFRRMAVLPPDSTAFTDTTVAAGETYSYRVAAVNGAGPSAYSINVDATALPPPPTVPGGLRLRIESGSVTVLWSPSAGAESYRVKRSLKPLEDFQVVGDAVTGTSFTDLGVETGTTYYFVVSAVNRGGESANSSAVSVTPGVDEPPLPPTRLRGTAKGKKVRLKWRQSASRGVVANRIYSARAKQGPFELLVEQKASTTALVPSPGRGKRFYVVTAVDLAARESRASKAVAVKR
ncbi:MAG: S8 family serine peptidase [Armatimonadota bacterium]